MPGMTAYSDLQSLDQKDGAGEGEGGGERGERGGGVGVASKPLFI